MGTSFTFYGSGFPGELTGMSTNPVVLVPEVCAATPHLRPVSRARFPLDAAIHANNLLSCRPSAGVWLHPIQVRYRAALRPVRRSIYWSWTE